MFIIYLTGIKLWNIDVIVNFGRQFNNDEK